MLRTLISTVQFLMIWCELPKPPTPPPPRATSMSTPPSNFYMMIRWHSCLLYTLYTHQHLISHFLGCSTFYVTPPPPPKKKKMTGKRTLKFQLLPFEKWNPKGFICCCRHWKICPKGPNFVGYFEVEIQTSYSKACHPKGIAKKRGTSLCRRSSHSPSKLLVVTA